MQLQEILAMSGLGLGRVKTPHLRGAVGLGSGVLSTQTEQADEHLVFLLCELLDGATAGLLQDAVDDGLLQGGVMFGVPRAFIMPASGSIR